MKTLTSKEIAEKVLIGRPLKKVKVSQEFGPSIYSKTQAWYKSWGWLGHNGIDFGTATGTKAYAVFPCTIRSAYWSDGGGYMMSADTQWFVHKGVDFKLRFYYLHLSKFEKKVGDVVELGDVVARTGNTGKYTTGAHLHFQVTPIYRIGVMEQKDSSNGYVGAVDPDPMFVDTGWRSLPVDRYYDKKRNWVLEYTFRFANTPVGQELTPFLGERVQAARYVHRRLSQMGRKRPILTDRETNAVIYGAWDLETVLDPAMFAIWGWYSKGEYEHAKENGIKLTTPLIAG